MVLLKHVYRRNQHFVISFRLFCLNASESKKESSAKLNPNAKHTIEVYDYLKNIECEHLFKKIPDHLLEKSTKKCLLINPKVAKQISQTLKLYVKDSYILESDPGFGFLSKELVHRVSYLRLYEESDLLRSYLRDFTNKHQEKIEVFDQSLQSVNRLMMEDQLDNGNRISLLFSDIPKDIKVNMIMVALQKTLVLRWINYVIFRNYFSNFSQLDLYFFVPPSIYTRLIASPQNDYYPRYHRFSVLTQVLFDIELLKNDIPRKSFLPWPKRSISKSRPRDVEKYENDYEVIYLIRMSPKQKNLLYLRDEKMYQCFSAFVAQNMVGKRRIVPYFETIIPGSGPRVIMSGYNIYSTFNELNPDEIFSLFVQFTKWPEFQSSAFYSYWKNSASLDDHEITEVDHVHSHDVDAHLHDEDDNDDDAFLPGNKVK